MSFVITSFWQTGMAYAWVKKKYHYASLQVANATLLFGQFVFTLIFHTSFPIYHSVKTHIYSFLRRYFLVCSVIFSTLTVQKNSGASKNVAAII